MIEELGGDEFLGDSFDGHKSRVRCFLHVLNLVAKSLLKQFDTAAANEDGQKTTEEVHLEELARELEEFERAAVGVNPGAPTGGGATSKGKKADRATEVEDEVGEDEDDPDDEADPFEGLSAAECAEIEAGMRPVKLVIAKVSSHIL